MLFKLLFIFFKATFRTNEPRYFDKESVLDDIIAANKTGNLEALHRHRKIYASRLPSAADDELLIEKSPQYAGGKDYIRKKRALAMKIINPNVKLVAIVCDPVKRAYSQLRYGSLLLSTLLIGIPLF